MSDGTPLRTLIVDDEPVARARLRAICAAEPALSVVVGEAASGSEALRRIEEERPDVVLLDIVMPELDGMAVAEALARSAAPPAVIFCTASPSHALEAFGLTAVDYLLKPVARARLLQALRRAAILRAGAGGGPPGRPVWLDHLWVPHRGAMVRVEVDGILRIEAEGDYVRLVLENTSYLLHETMARLAERLDPDRFARIRRSIIVRLDQLQEMEHVGGGQWNVSLRDGTIVRAGATYWKALKRRLTPT